MCLLGLYVGKLENFSNTVHEAARAAAYTLTCALHDAARATVRTELFRQRVQARATGGKS